ncbi:hypothetical protein EW145_g4647 [Phellinidium pouzarii]|uniref:Chloride channel protein n=1 Tax=Phellinidium pouzarii TaxID=167371 RepID=A0A4V3XCF4_9AGAM|nr:hypothetical protein EW145_g4647 [Phellinidium pouzarii]
MHTLQRNYWAVRDYLSPVLKESKFKEHGRITPEEFVAAGDFLTYKFPVWTWEKGDASKARDYLPLDKQYLVTRGVPCLRRAASLAYTDADEDAERLLSFSDSAAPADGDEWVETHAGRKASQRASAAGIIEDIPDVDDAPTESATDAMANMSLSGATSIQANETPDFDEIPDMEEDLEGEDDEATAAPVNNAIEANLYNEVDATEGGLLRVRTYDVMITYDKFYQTPAIWLLGYDENGTPLKPAQIFQDVPADHAFKTVTIEPFLHSTSLQAALVHPCKHASRKLSGGPLITKDKEGKKKWLFRRASGNKDDKTVSSSPGEEEEVEGMRVDYYLVIFLKFIASIVPTIEDASWSAAAEFSFDSCARLTRREIECMHMDSERAPLNDTRSREALNVDEMEQISRYEDFTTIDWIEDSILERNRRLRIAEHERVEQTYRGPNGEITLSWVWIQVLRAISASQTWLVVSLAGICIGINAAITSIITEWLSDLKMGYCSDGWWLNQQFCCWEIEGDENACGSWHAWSSIGFARWLVYVLFASLFSFISAHLVKSFAKYAAGSGISEIKCILAGFIMKGYLGAWTWGVKSLTLPLVIASGLSVGKEGPSVHVACCLGYIVAQLFGKFAQSQGKMREIITAASAAGVAVAFGSPIGGVLFSIEEMSHTFSIKTMWRSFLCALVATVTLSTMNPFRTGKLVLFQVTYDRDWHFFEIMFFIIIGIFGGLYGVLVIKFNLQVAAFRKKFLAKHGVAEAVTLASLTAMICYFNRFLRIDMTESLAVLFHECDAAGDIDNLCQTSVQWKMASSLFLATVIRTGLVIISYGCKVPAGIFIPSMAIGATFGRMIGIMVKAFNQAYPHLGIFAVCQPDVSCITPGTYAFLGAAAALGGIMRITVTVVVIMFELTGALTYILPTMIVLLVTKAVGDFFGINGIADEMIRFNGYPFLEKEDHAFHTTVSSVMRTELETLSAAGLQVGDVEYRLQQSSVKGFPVIFTDHNRLLLGYIGRRELRYIIGSCIDAIDKAKRTHGVSTNTPCSFYSVPSHHDREEIANLATGPAIAIDDEVFANITNETASTETLDLWPWTPLTVSPQLPLEIVMQLFKRMGPRVILVEQHGKLVGLVTVKDVLRNIASEQSDNFTWGSRAGIDDLVEEWSSTSSMLNSISSWWYHMEVQNTPS